MSAFVFGWSAKFTRSVYKSMASVVLMALVFSLAPVGGFQFAEAARTVNSVLVDGGSSGSFIPSESVYLSVTVQTTGSGSDNDWESTAWRVGGSGVFNCENTPDHTSTSTNTETFSITAPSTVGSYGIEIVAYDGDTCSAASPSATLSVANAIVVVEPFAETFNISEEGSFSGTKMSDPAGGDSTDITGSSSGSDTTQNGDALNKFAKIGQDEYICADIDASGFANLMLSYAKKGNTDAEVSDVGVVEYKASGTCDDASGWTEFSSASLGGATWATVGPTALPNALDDSSFILRFRNDSSSSNENWRIDDVVVSGEIAEYGTLQIAKVVTNNNGGVSVPENFTFSINGGDPITFESDGQNDIAVLVGTYSIVEVGGPAGYDASYVNCTDVEVTSGGTTLCTITNDDIAPTLTIVKEALGGDDEFGFTATDNDAFTDTYSIETESGSGQTDVIDLPSAGTYDITESTIPTDWDFTSVECTINDTPTGSDIENGKTITLGIGEEATCTFTNTARGSISVTKYSDPAEGSFQFDLTGPNEFSDSHTFSPEGSWSVFSLIPGNYTLSETILSPEDWTGSQLIACDGDGENDTNGSIANPFALLLQSGEGLSCIVNNTQDAVISGKKFEDEDGAGESIDGSGISGWTITLEKYTEDDPETVEEDESGWDEVDTEVTDGEGDYSFLAQPGTYRVCEVYQEDWTQSYPTGGASCAEGEGYEITAEAGMIYNGKDFGNYQLGTITGNKFYDSNADGSWDTEAELGLEGWIIYIDQNENQQRDEGEPYATTDNTGHYEISSVEPGTYAVREEFPAEENWAQIAPVDGYHEVTVTSGATVGSYNFGNIEGGVISGYKWNDADGDGNWGEESALEGISIVLHKIVDEAEEYVGSTTTDGMGYYEFTGLTPGTYVVSENPGNFWMQTFPAGEEGHTVVLGVVEGSVENVDQNNFGNIAVVPLSGTKFNDLDNDGYWDGVHGVAETTEPGIADWTIYATPITEEGGEEDTESGRSAKEAVTDEDGEYSFQFLATEEGWWRISEQAQAQWEQTYPYTEGGYYDVYISPEGPLMEAPQIPDLGPQANSFMQVLAWITGAEFAFADEVSYEAHFDSEEGIYEYYDFGNWQWPEIEIAKWHDIDADGEWDEDEAGIEGFTFAIGVQTENEVEVEGEEGPETVIEVQTEIIALGLTDADGYAHIRVPVAGEYVVFEQQGDYWIQTYPAVSRPLENTPTFSEDTLLFDALGVGTATTEQPALDTESFFSVSVTGTSGAVADVGNPGNESTVALEFGNWAYPIIEAVKYHDENEDGVRNWTDITQEGNTDGLKDENESYTENGVAEWPIALGRVVETAISEEEGPITAIDIEIVDLQLTDASGTVQLHAPIGNEWYIVLEATQDGWTPISPLTRSESLQVNGYAEGVDDSYTLYTTSFFDVYVDTSMVEPLTQGSSSSSLGERRERETIEFGNFEEPVTTSTGGGGGNGQIVGSAVSAPGFFGGGSNGGGTGSNGGNGGSEQGSGGSGNTGGEGQSPTGGTDNGGSGGSSVVLEGGTTITATETTDGGTELILQNADGETVTIDSANPDASNQLASAQASGVFNDVPDWAWLLLLMLLLLGAGGYYYWGTVRSILGA